MAIVDKPWVPIRIDIESDPRVIAIARECDKHLTMVPSQYRRKIVCWALRTVWSYWTTHAVDGRVAGFTPTDVDNVADLAGLGRAMATVRKGEQPWMVFDDDGAYIPDFKRWHWITLRQRASDAGRQSRHRNRTNGKRHADVTADVTPVSRPMSRSRHGECHGKDRDENVTPIKTETETKTVLLPPSSSFGGEEGAKPPPEAWPEFDDDEARRRSQRVIAETGCDRDVGDALTAFPALTHRTVCELADECRAAKPKNPTGWWITKLRDMRLIPRGWRP